jgi:hypothetical protein
MLNARSKVIIFDVILVLVVVVIGLSIWFWSKHQCYEHQDSLVESIRLDRSLRCYDLHIEDRSLIYTTPTSKDEVDEKSTDIIARHKRCPLGGEYVPSRVGLGLGCTSKKQRIAGGQG